MSDIPELTNEGERLTPDCYGPIVGEHMHRYALANLFVKGKDVLDIASGEGYGSNFLSFQAKSVKGVDIAADAIKHAQAKYRRENLTFLVGDCLSIPIDSQSIDVVVSFETLEHIAEHDHFLTEIKRVLRQDGMLIISTPDKRNYSDKRKFKNKFHIKEIYSEEFKALLGGYFRNLRFGRQFFKNGSIIEFDSASKFLIGSGDYANVEYKNIKEEAMYCIAIASDAHVPRVNSGIFNFFNEIPQAPAAYARCEVFVSSTGEFVAEKSQAFNIHTEGKTTLQFKELQKHIDRGSVYLRIDPLDRVGVFSFLKILICFKDKSEDAAVITRQIDLDKDTSSSLNCTRFENGTEHSYLSLDDDPQIVLKPFEWIGTKDWWLEIEIDSSLDIHAVSNQIGLNKSASALVTEAADLKIKLLDEIKAHQERLAFEKTQYSEEISIVKKQYDDMLARLREIFATEQEVMRKELEDQKFRMQEVIAQRNILQISETALKESAEKSKEKYELLMARIADEQMRYQSQILTEKARYEEELGKIKSHYEDLVAKIQGSLAAEQENRRFEHESHQNELHALKVQHDFIQAGKIELEALVKIETRQHEALKKQIELEKENLKRQMAEARIRYETELAQIKSLFENSLRQIQQTLFEERNILHQENENLATQNEALRSSELRFKLAHEMQHRENIEQKESMQKENARLQQQILDGKKEYETQMTQVRTEFENLLVISSGKLVFEQKTHQSALANLQQSVDEVTQKLACEEKIQQQIIKNHFMELSRIHNSIFWKLARPFRAVSSWPRKFFINRRQSRIVRSSTLVRKMMEFNIEAPESRPYQKSRNPVIVTGWCFDITGNGAKLVRVRVGRRTIICSQIERPDVVSYFKDRYVLSQSTGFRAEFKTGAGLKRLRIEACLQSGEWVQLGTRLLMVEPYLPPAQAFSLPGDDAPWNAESELDTNPVNEPDVKAIAFYLPQFHSIPENDQWWGEGFTEWSNVRPAQPQFAGHYQPHEPIQELGYYDLNDSEILCKQANMARAAGIYGFCYYYYWFDGKRLLEKPLDQMLKTGRPAMPFCFCWANENWSRRWDGCDSEILIAQNHSAQDDVAIITDIITAFMDQRYIRIEGRPLLIIYRPLLLPDPQATFARWRTVCREAGIGEIYLAGVKGFGCVDPISLGLDAIVEFPPNDSGIADRSKELVAGVGSDFDGKLYDYREARANCGKIGPQGFPFYRGVAPSWDNTARRKNQASVFVNSSPSTFYNWLLQAMDFTMRYLPAGQRFLFINAWNEWAEGCHLEPDRKYGYAWLNATRRALGAYKSNDASQAKNPDLLSAVFCPGAQSSGKTGRVVLPAPEIQAIPTLVISALFYYNEDLIFDFIDNIIPQVAHLIKSRNCQCKVVMLLNFPAAAKIIKSIEKKISPLNLGSGGMFELCAPGFNRGFGSGHNFIFNKYKSDIFIIINSDLRVEKKDWLCDILDSASGSPAPAIIGPRASAARLREDGCGIEAPDPLGQGFDFVDGSLLALNSKLAGELGLFNEVYRYFYFEDVDICLRYFQAGYGASLLDIPVNHARSSSSKLISRNLIKSVLDNNRSRFFSMWGTALESHCFSNQLGLHFLTRDKNIQVAALPSVFGLLRDHPRANVAIAGVDPLLAILFKHPRIQLVSNTQIREGKTGYDRFHEIGQLSGNDPLLYKIADSIGVIPQISLVAEHIKGLTGKDRINNIKAPNSVKAIVLAGWTAQSIAGIQPKIDVWNVFLTGITRAGYAPVIFTDAPKFLVPKGWTNVTALAAQTIPALIAAMLDSACFFTAEHWTLQLAQILDVKTLSWHGSMAPSELVWNWRKNGVYADCSLDCLACMRDMGNFEENFCIRGDEYCMGISQVKNYLTTAVEFLKVPEICKSYQVTASRRTTFAHQKKDSAALDLSGWKRLMPDSLLVLIPHKPGADKAQLEKTEQLVRKALVNIPNHRIIFDDRGEAPPRGAHPVRQAALAAIRQGMIDRHLKDERWVFWLDDDIVDFSADMIEELILRSGGGITAPLVIMEGEIGYVTPDGFGPGLFFDIAGFVEDGRWASFKEPYFRQAGPIFELDSVGSCYLVNADIYRNGAKHEVDPATRTLLEAGGQWLPDAIKICQSGPAIAYTEHYSVCAFAKRNNLPVRAFADLVAKHKRTL